MNILITGSSGHLGMALSIVLSKSTHEVTGIDIQPSKYTHHIGSIADKSFVQKCMQGIDIVLHTATLHKPHIVTHNEQDFIDTNITGTLNLLAAAQQAGVKSFIFTSTTSTFGDAMKSDDTAVWVTEKLVPQPKNIYGVTKVAAENLCQLYHRNHELPCIILRTSRFFSEADDDKKLRNTYVDANIKANELLYRRVDIQDVVDAHLLAIQQAPIIGFGRYIISGTTPFTIADLKNLYADASTVLNKYHPGFKEVYATKKWNMFPSIGRVYVNNLAREVLNWQPKYNFQWVLDCLQNGQDFRSPLAIEVGVRGYHEEAFEEGPYPVKSS